MILYYSGTGNSWMIANRGEWMGEIPVSKNLCRKKGWKFMGFNFLVMSQCNIMMHKMLSPEENENIIREAMPKVEQIAELISAGTPLLPDKKAFPLMTDIGAPMTDFFYQMKAKKFYVTDACIGCGKCAKICVNSNITLVDKNLYGNRTVWPVYLVYRPVRLQLYNMIRKRRIPDAIIKRSTSSEFLE